ncbi:hypothetical protein PIB30_034656 [Stylosanthes scabra]|uniref:Uncharacterized protein n=1 Tax=Stylosanthes scabra TaxID=79078 RepID=A0ABU6ZCC0_9FABA|nr:hypothetical protein [Stylosanthes scabra]
MSWASATQSGHVPSARTGGIGYSRYSRQNGEDPVTSNSSVKQRNFIDMGIGRSLLPFSDTSSIRPILGRLPHQSFLSIKPVQSHKPFPKEKPGSIVVSHTIADQTESVPTVTSKVIWPHLGT